jgi:CheY-like chemotaxis protein
VTPGTPRVPIVDDNAQFRDAARRVLQAAGIAVVAAAADAAAVLRLAGELHPDVVLADVQAVLG